MSRFDRKTSRCPFQSTIAALTLLTVLGVTGCATGKQSSLGFDPAPIQGPTPLVSPQPTPVQPYAPGVNGPVIQPRDSSRQPQGHQPAEFDLPRSFGWGSPPKISPRNVPSPLASPADAPLIRHTPPAAALSGKIEIVPKSHIADSTSQRTFFDIVPNEPAKLNPEGVELLPSPVHGRYEELPPPPE